MVDLSAAALKLGIAAVKAACKIWLRDQAVAADVTATVAEMLSQRVSGTLQQRKLAHLFDDFAFVVADRFLPLYDRELANLADNERLAAVYAVAETLDRAPLDDALLFSLDLDPRYVERHLRDRTASLHGSWALSEEGTQLYDLLLRETCAYVLEITATLPRFTSGALTEVLRRQSLLSAQLAQVLDRLPARRSLTGDEGFLADYRRQVARVLDRLELVGAGLSEMTRTYPLSIAYISLAVAPVTQRSPTQAPSESDRLLRTLRSEFTGAQSDPVGLLAIPVEEALAQSRRVFIRGDAGSGKTTLLRWLAVTSARQGFSGAIQDWNDSVPFLIPLRRYASSEAMPSPAEFLHQVGRSLTDEMPKGWANRLLKDGQALVLVDGVDELPKSRREQALQWLEELLTSYPDARYVVTSRPASMPQNWLNRDQFLVAGIQPMGFGDVRQFIRHWHEAARSQVIDQELRRELDKYELGLLEIVPARRDLRQLATNPLLCALLCALNMERRTHLPRDRIELYEVALDMFLQRRDAERRVGVDDHALSREDKADILGDLAYWLMRNGLSDADRQRVCDVIDRRVRNRRHVTGTPSEVLEYLVERSGLLVETSGQHVGFIHRTFQEYLAAQAVVAGDDIEALLQDSADDQWRQVVVLVAGVAGQKQRARLMSGLLYPPRKARARQDSFDLLAIACVETVRDLDEQIHAEITARARRMLPPSRPEDVSALRPAGEFALELIDPAAITSHEQARFSALLAGAVGGPIALSLLERLASKRELMHPEHLVGLWDFFDPSEYAERVLAPAGPETVEMRSSSLIPGVRHLASVERLVCRFGQPWYDYSFLADMPSIKNATLVITDRSAALRISIPTGLLCLSVACLPAGRSLPPEPFDPRQRTEAGAALPSPPSRGRLNLIGVDAKAVLDKIELDGTVQWLVIDDDPLLVNLRELRIPPGMVRLDLRRCRALTNLSGIEALTGTPLSQLGIYEIGWRLDLTALLTTTAGTPSPSGQRQPVMPPVQQLTRIDLDISVGGGPFESLMPKGFTLDVDTASAGDNNLHAIWWRQ